MTSRIAGRVRFAGRGEEIEKAQRGPVRTVQTTVGRIPGWRAVGQRPRLFTLNDRLKSSPLVLLLSGSLDPSSQHSPNLSDHIAGVVVLAIIDPFASMDQTKIEPNFVELGIGDSQVALTSPSPFAHRVKDRFLKIEG